MGGPDSITWVLRSASNGRFKESMLAPLDTGPNYSKFMRDYTLKQFEGFHVLADEVIESQVVNLSSVKNDSIRDATELVTAYDLIYIFKPFLLILSMALTIGTTANLCSKKFLGINLLK